jgi:hypothetical protein
MHSCGKTAIKRLKLAQLLGQLGVFLTFWRRSPGEFGEFGPPTNQVVPVVLSTVIGCCPVQSWPQPGATLSFWQNMTATTARLNV